MARVLGFPRWVSLGTGFARVDQRSGVRCCASGAEAGLKKIRRMSAASIALEVAEAGQLVSAQTIHHTLQQVSLHGRHPRRKPLLKLAHKKKPANSLPKTIIGRWKLY